MTDRKTIALANRQLRAVLSMTPATRPVFDRMHDDQMAKLERFEAAFLARGDNMTDAELASATAEFETMRRSHVEAVEHLAYAA